MNAPRVFTSEFVVAPRLRSLGRFVERVGLLAWILAGAALALGFRFEKPGERLSEAEKALAGIAARVSVLEANYVQLNGNQETAIRLLCVSMTRHDADIAGACSKYPTRDESTRTVR